MGKRLDQSEMDDSVRNQVSLFMLLMALTAVTGAII